MIVRTKTVESEGIPATPIIEAEKIPTTPITGGGGGETLPPNILENTTFSTGKVTVTGTIDKDSSYVTSGYIQVESGYDYLIVLESENDGTQNAYVGCYSGAPTVSGFTTRTYIPAGSNMNYLIKLVTPPADYIRLSVRADNGDVKISVIKVDISTITNYIDINL